MADRTQISYVRKYRTLPVPDVCKLESAVCPRFREPHTHYVEFPFEAGLQPCLIEFIQPNQIMAVVGTVALLPSDAPHSQSLEHETYGRYLSLIKREFRNDIRHAFGKNKLFESWDESSFAESPFRGAQLSKLTDCIDALLANPCRSAQPIPTWLRKELASLEQANLLARRWEPQHYWRDKIAKDLKVNWWIIGQWPEWDARQLTWSDRFRQYAPKFHIRIPTSNRKWFKAVKGVFVHRCRFLGLECSYKPKRRSNLINPTSW